MHYVRSKYPSQDSIDWFFKRHVCSVRGTTASEIGQYLNILKSLLLNYSVREVSLKLKIMIDVLTLYVHTVINGRTKSRQYNLVVT